MDAEGFHFAPALGLGLKKNLSNKWSLNTGYTFFQSPFSGATDYTFNIHTVDILGNLHFSNSTRGLFIGLGPAFQVRNDEFYRIKNKKDLMLAINFGYDFQVKMFGGDRLLTADLKAFGPAFYDGTVEILTQLMVGIRVRFARGNNR
jgi:hypothetical protein